MYLIVGLGNPTKTYEGTRHNVGFSMIDVLADKFNIDVTTKKHKALVGKGIIEGMKVILAKPQTYMNLSGEAVREIIDFYKIEPENIISHLGTQEFPRIRVGIGEKPKEWDLADYVLSKYSKDEQEAFKEAADSVIGAVKLMVMDDVDGAMNQYNAKKRDA